MTIIGLQFGGLFGGAVLTETIFNLAGVGRAVTEAIGARDYAVIQGFTLVIAIGLRRGEPARRHLVRLSRPADPVELTMAVTTPPAMELLDERERRSGRSSIWRDTLGNLLPPAERRRRWHGPGLLHLHRGLRGCDRHASPEPGPHRGRRRQEARAPVHPPVRLPGDPAGALLRHRWQRPRRVQPGRARHAHLAPDRLRDGRVRHPHRRLHRRAGGLRRRQARQLPDADHGRAARLSRPCSWRSPS